MTCTQTTKLKRIKTYIVDGIQYKSSTFVKYHKEFQEAINNNIIHSFVLPNNDTSDKQESKYKNNNKVIIDNKHFDSIMEARFYVFLCRLKKDFKIKDFDCQIIFKLQEGYRNLFTSKKIQPINYIADFVVTLNNDIKVVIDVKGIKTADFRLKEKMFGYKYPTLCFMCVQWRAKTNSWETLDDIEKERRTKKKKNKEKIK